jgi:hypothetical protein
MQLDNFLEKIIYIYISTEALTISMSSIFSSAVPVIFSQGFFLNKDNHIKIVFPLHLSTRLFPRRQIITSEVLKMLDVNTITQKGSG